MTERTCTECAAMFKPVGRQVCCSDLCKRERRRKYARSYAAERYVPAVPRADKACKVCGNAFTPYRATSIYCSDLCKMAAQNERKRAALYGTGKRDCSSCGAVGVVDRKPGTAVCDGCKSDPRDPATLRAKQQRRRLRMYGLTQHEYDIMWLAQGERCVCGASSPTAKGWCIDHCHATGAVRGILCSPCNLALGQLGDDASRLRLLAAYLDRSL